MKKMLTKLTSLVLLPMLLSALLPAAPAQGALPLPSAQTTSIQAIPQQFDGVAYLPLKPIATKLGFAVKWNKSTQQIEINRGNLWTTLIVEDNSYFYARMAPETLSGAPILRDGVTFVPVEFFPHILKVNLTIQDGKYFINEEMSAEHSGYIQKIETGAQSKMVYIASSMETDKFEEITILHVSKATILQTDLTVGKLITAQCPPIMAMSLPGQTSANIIFVTGPVNR